jgi:hypothetical protein
LAITRSAAELLARASSRERVVPADARSGAVFERIVVGPDRYFIKRLSFASDWVMRAIGDRVCRQYLVWQEGIMDRSRTASITPSSPWTGMAQVTTRC